MVDPERSRQARRAALIRWSRTSTAQGAKTGLKAQEALDAKLMEEIDPAGELAPAEAARRLKQARRAHFIDLANKSAKARKKATTD